MFWVSWSALNLFWLLSVCSAFLFFKITGPFFFGGALIWAKKSFESSQSTIDDGARSKFPKIQWPWCLRQINKICNLIVPWPSPFSISSQKILAHKILETNNKYLIQKWNCFFVPYMYKIIIIIPLHKSKIEKNLSLWAVGYRMINIIFHRKLESNS